MQESVEYPGRMMVVIIGNDREEVESDLYLLSDSWNEIEFTQPEKLPDGRWGIRGHVS
jgi:hypothetical protein